MGGRAVLLLCVDSVRSTQGRVDAHACLSQSTKNGVLLSPLVRGISVAGENLCSYLLLISRSLMQAVQRKYGMYITRSSEERADMTGGAGVRSKLL